VGDQVTVDLSSPSWEIPDSILNLGKRVEYIYIVRDNVSGEVLKVGSTADIETRAGVYARAGRDWSLFGTTGQRSLSMEIQPVKLNKAHSTVESIEIDVRKSVIRGITAERGPEPALTQTKVEPLVLPWDATGGRLPVRGSGIPGVRGHEEREAGIYWWRERKWGTDAGPVPQRQVGVVRPKGVPGDPQLGKLLRNHGGNVSAVARELNVPRTTLQDYIYRNGLSVKELMDLAGQ
jgi:hypothetical protein